MDSQMVQIVANAVSTLTVLSCLFLKVPQIIYIKKRQSAEGIYLQAMLMEITGYVFKHISLLENTNISFE